MKPNGRLEYSPEIPKIVNNNLNKVIETYGITFTSFPGTL